MATDDTAKLLLAYLRENQASAEVTHNDALNRLDFIIQLAAAQRNVNDPPETPANGNIVLVGPSPTGVFVGHAGDLVAYYDGWIFATPNEGWRMWVSDEDVNYYYDGTSWLVDNPSGQGLAFKFEYDSATADADPGAGKFRLNNADLSAATEIYIDDETKDGMDLSSCFMVKSGFLLIANISDSGNYLGFKVTKASLESGYKKLTIALQKEIGTPEVLADEDQCIITFEALSKLYGAYVKVVDSKADGTAGGAFAQGAWRTRVCTEESDPDEVCGVAANKITLAAGTYRCLISAPAYFVGFHQLRLYNTTGGATLVLGSSAYCGATTIQNRSVVAGRFTVAGSQELEIQHRCGTTRAADGFGRACSFGINEIYTIGEFWKEA
jgi:hypothetical protein